eukprot:CAMPEP_0197022680 /NCGR_PEP_ID=MMETSP1384-20130603/3493_1 /TAXON_ID=29189 /ORGANISM="Ammonia sp." /LENGTH=611 /DNA_ID=CAMNT_0042450765 /DNA_START=99 /DNA_END=1934 /DNA_ORIENTATION=+
MPKKQKKGENVKIFARVRNLMPWEPRKTSLQVCTGNKLRNKTEKTMNEYSFNKVFGIDVNNDEIYQTMVMPMIDNVLKGFNAILIAYGQTGSGKTFTMLGKPNLGVIGLLPMTLKEFVDTKSVHKLELSAVEAFGHHVAKIELFDLYHPPNQTPVWNQKKGDTGQEMAKAIRKQCENIDQAYSLIRYAHAASHFAPTGKNPESSRGHVTFVSKVYQDAPDGSNNDLISYFVFLDCAGSEGETAFTADFIASVDKTTLMARRLEAGCINTGLSGLQVIFNELRVRGKLSKVLGNGLRRVLHPYINTKTFLAVIFTFSPSVNNSKATESTLKFAVTAGMVKVQPVKAELSMNIDKLAQQLRKNIEENEKVLAEQEDKIIQMSSELEGLKQQLVVLNLDFGDIERADAEEYGAYGGNISAMDTFNQSSKWKGKDVSHLQKSVLDQFKYLDEDEEDDWGDLDMFNTATDSKLEAELEKELAAALKADKKQAGAARLLKAAVGVEYADEDQDEKLDIGELEARLEETLDLADEDVNEIQNKMDTIASMTGKTIKMDFDSMTTDDLTAHCEETWEQIEGNKDEQSSLKKTQENVVGHLVETNEWLFAALQETLNENL